MKKKIVFIILVAISIFMCFPVIFLLAGSFMSVDELSTYLAPVLAEKGKGYVSWGLLPSYPTLRAYVELLFDTPEFFVMFWNSVKIVFLSVAGQLIVGIPAAWGFARYKFPFKKVLFTIYIVVMLMPFQVTMLSSYLVLDKLHLLNTHGSIILPAIFSTFSVTTSVDVTIALVSIYNSFLSIKYTLCIIILLNKKKREDTNPLSIYLVIEIYCTSFWESMFTIYTFLIYSNLCYRSIPECIVRNPSN